MVGSINVDHATGQ